MPSRFLDLVVTPAVAREQQRVYGIAHAPGGDAAPEPLGPDEAEFIAARDSFYLASVTETGWPYVQHRGGPPGFLHVLDAHTLAFARHGRHDDVGLAGGWVGGTARQAQGERRQQG